LPLILPHFFFGIEDHPFFRCRLSRRALLGAKPFFLRRWPGDLEVAWPARRGIHFVIRQLHGSRDRQQGRRHVGECLQESIFNFRCHGVIGTGNRFIAGSGVSGIVMEKG
jgi:hypothetical protein